jgi:hypothetical protein
MPTLPGWRPCVRVSLRKEFIVPELKLLTVIGQGVHWMGLVRFRDVCVSPGVSEVQKRKANERYCFQYPLSPWISPFPLVPRGFCCLLQVFDFVLCIEIPVCGRGLM